jgi:hypothetical protein
MKERRRHDSDEPRWIPCRACGEPLVLDPARMERLGGRIFIECGSCRDLIWIRRSDLREAMPVGAAGQSTPNHFSA